MIIMMIIIIAVIEVLECTQYSTVLRGEVEEEESTPLVGTRLVMLQDFFQSPVKPIN